MTIEFLLALVGFLITLAIYFFFVRRPKDKADPSNT